MPPSSSSSSSSTPAEIDKNDTHPTPFSAPFRQYSSGRLSSSPSLLSSPNYSSSSPDDSPLISPSTPFRSFGIPFSWEKLPGIPKKVLSKKKVLPQNALPLPPARSLIPSKKFNYQNSSVSPIRKKYYNTSQSSKKDPFFAALVECSKEDDQGSIDGNFGSKITRSLSDRFGFVSMYTSCKSGCQVSESIVYIRRR